MSKVRQIKVSADDNGQRLDRWLKRIAPDLPYVLVQKLLRKGQIRIDGKRAKPDQKLETGQEVRLPPESKAGRNYTQGDAKTGVIADRDIMMMRAMVIYDDGDVIALNKPPGLPVQGGLNIMRHIDGLLPALKNDEGVVPRLVHRLDRDTSGVLLCARSAEVARRLGAQFKNRTMHKTYWALVEPAPESPAGLIRAPLMKQTEGPNKDCVVVDTIEGKNALTDYVVIEKAGEALAFVAFRLQTGRMHQIRVHAQVLGTPIIGDKKYGTPSEHLDHVDLLHLHARRISCPHPMGKGRLDITAPLPPGLEKSWKSFGFDSHYKIDPFDDD